jgi:hypothetical protein
VEELYDGSHQRLKVMTVKPQTALAKIDLATECPEVEIVPTNDPVKLAASMENEELLTHLKTQLGGLQHKIEENRPYLIEAHSRFSQQGRRIPISGFPSWSEWVRINLHVHIRTAQRWLTPPKEASEKKTRIKRPRNVRPLEPLRDWPAAQRKANDLVLSVKRLKAQTAVGTDMLIEPIQELALMIGYQLVKK